MAYDYSYAYTSYLDESFDSGKAGLFAVGGIIAQGVGLFELDRKWKNLCEKYDIAYFKASECEYGRGQFTKFVTTAGEPTDREKEKLREISLDFVGLIADEMGVVGHGITIDQEEFYRVLSKNPAAKAVLRDDPYRLGYDLAMVQCAWIMKEIQLDFSETSPFGTRIKHPHVSFVCDEHEQYGPLASAAYQELKTKNPEAGQYMATFESADDKELPVLQAADAVAYTVRRSSKVGLGFLKTGFSREFELLEKTHKLGLIQHANKENLENAVKIQKPGESFNLSDIMENVFHADIKFPFR
ncbi:MAG: DUF3800 domain-containing protein [Candidatus Acidiferrales bacterium]